MKILFIAHEPEARYGANLSLLGLVDGLRTMEVECAVLIPSDGGLKGELEKRGVRCIDGGHEMWAGRGLSLLARIRRTMRTRRLVGQMAKKLHSEGFDLVYTNSSVVGFGYWLSRAMELPHVWHLREFGEKDHQMHPDLGEWLTRRLIRKSEGIIAVSGAVRDHFLEGRPHANCHVIYNGIAWRKEIESRPPAKVNGEAKHTCTFTLVGFVAPWKGQQLAIEALAKLSRSRVDAKLFVVGSGQPDHIKALKELAASLGVVNAVEFTGYSKEPQKYVEQSDAVLMCSQMEGMGRVTVEAMIAGKPVIGRAAGGTLELIENGGNGYLFDGTPYDLARCMQRVIDDRVEARRMGYRAWERACRDFCIEKYAQEVMNVVRTTVGKYS